jgi:hypothetical protein
VLRECAAALLDRLRRGFARIHLEDPLRRDDAAHEILEPRRVGREVARVEVARVPVEQDLAEVEEDRVEQR